MSIINVRISDVDKKLIENYAKSKNMTISEVVRESIDDIIENEIHLKLYQEGMKALEEDETTYTHDEVLKEFGIKKENL